MSLDQAQLFREEALELLSEVEQILLELEVDPSDSDKVDKLFRAMHTVKGSGAMFGFDDVAHFTHEVETLWDQVRSGQLVIVKELLDVTLLSRDHILELLAEPGEVARAVSEELIGRLRRLAGAEPEAAPEGDVTPAQTNLTPRMQATWWLRYRPKPDCFLSGVDPMGFLRELGEMGRSSPVAHVLGVLPLQDCAPESVAVWWDVLIETAESEDTLRGVFLFVEDDHEIHLRKLAFESLRQADTGDFLARLSASKWEEYESLATDLDGLATSFMAARQGASACRQASAAKGHPKDGSDGAASIRVEAGRLDSMVDMVGELAAIESRLTQAVGHESGFHLRSIAEDLQRLSRQLRDEVLGLRMVPIGGIFGTLRRLVRDLADGLGKQAVFVGEGGDTELDKNVIDRLKDPLVHILRNCVDHGLEAPEMRQAAGKPVQGSVRLHAEHAGGEVRITISDDGGGVNLERVRQKAESQGLLAPGEEADARRLLDFLFAPGFSTAQAVSSVSGRGVGMDVVKSNIEALNGEVRLNTNPGQGTTITVRLPLTLAIIDGLQVRVGSEVYTVPLSNSLACLERFLDSPPPAVGVIDWRGQMTPCLSLRRLLNVVGRQPEYERVIMVTAGDTVVGLAVDAVIGQHQAVIKRLSDIYSDVDFVSGTSVNGDGSISLILDVPQLVRFAAEA